MEYKRIHGVQVISPSKLRMKLIGVHSHFKNEGGTPFSISSPSKLEELEHSKGSLLGDRDDEGDAGRIPPRQPVAAGPFNRPIPSKWYDAEKWIIARQPAQPNIIKKTLMQHSCGDPQPPDEVTKEAADTSSSAAEGTKSSVTMKETGTEMTPMASHEPSRTATPNGACTPSRSPAGSTPQTPRAVPPPGSPPAPEELSDEERRMKTRREILALGLQLGKMNIAAWASKADEAAVRPWVEAEKTKHNARFKREEMKIQVWESHEKAKTEAEMRRVEAQAEKMKVEAHEKMMRKLSEIKQRAGEKLAAAEARRERQVAAAYCQVEQPPPHGGCRRFCCLWFSKFCHTL